MGADIVNLRRARKARTRLEREHAAEANRRLHGRTRAERQRDAAESERAEKHIAQHRIVRDED